jgi:hypothetical protein
VPSGNTDNAPSVPPVIGGTDAQVQTPGGSISQDSAADTAPPPAISENPIAAPTNFKYLDSQLNKMDKSLSDESGESSGTVTTPVSTITRATTKIMKHIVVPGIATVGTASLGYMLLFGRTMYSAIAMLMGLGLGGQKLDPATLLDYWEREGSRRRDDHEKKLEGLFG